MGVLTWNILIGALLDYKSLTMAGRLPIEYEGAFCHLTSRRNDRKWKRKERAKGVVISSTGERTKVELGIRANGWKVLEGGEAYQL